MVYRKTKTKIETKYYYASVYYKRESVCVCVIVSACILCSTNL